MRTALLRSAEGGCVEVYGDDLGGVFAWVGDVFFGPALPPDLDVCWVEPGQRGVHRPGYREPTVRTKAEADRDGWWESIDGDTATVELRAYGVRIVRQWATLVPHLCEVEVWAAWDAVHGEWVVERQRPADVRRQFVG